MLLNKGNYHKSILLAHNWVFHTKIKHINIWYYFFGTEIPINKIELIYMPIAHILADK